jgi:hypothetical protein
LALKLYIAYGTAADQVIALRLQALAAVNGLSVYVPPAYTRRVGAINLEPESEAKLIDSDLVLGVVTTGMSDACRQELNTARNNLIKSIILADPTPAFSLQEYFPGNIIVIDPTNPARAEQEIVQVLEQAKVEQAAKTALIALGTLALGLMLFAPQD